MENSLFFYNPWWEDTNPKFDLWRRENFFEDIETLLSEKRILLLTGLRRVGKTSLMKLSIQHLLEKGIKPKNIFYISMDDYAFKNNTIHEIVTLYRKIQKLKSEEKVYLFFDEVTYKNDYDIQLKNLFDKENAKIVATSSSSSLLRDKKAYLTGRATIVEIQPLDFFEYLDFKNITVKKRDSALLDSYFKDYIKIGGLPENILYPERQYLMGLVDDIIQKDITAFHGLKNGDLLRDYFLLLMERSGKQISINKIANILKISPDTSKRYLSYFEDTYLIHLVSRWGKTNEKILTPKKIYSCDLGIKFLFHGDRDMGSYFENYVYLLLRKKKKLYYLLSDEVELDFFTQDKILVEAKYDTKLNPKQEKLFKEFKANKKILVDSILKTLELKEI
ncbi:MAG: ATP-binding protein [Leptospiraceae bacterium]|nr:ATP-binding protein [Leptospiraceae bacterium]